MQNNKKDNLKQSLIIEFSGLPGAGKTSLTEAVEKLILSDEISSILPEEIKKNYRSIPLIKKIFMSLSHIGYNIKFLVHAYRYTCSIHNGWKNFFSVLRLLFHRIYLQNISLNSSSDIIFLDQLCECHR